MTPISQATLKDVVTFDGKGLHTGHDVTVEIRPASKDHGVTFKRIDTADANTIKLSPESVSRTDRGTTIGSGESEVNTIEHLMSALTGLGISNAEINLNGPEIPILDGSSAPIVEAILEKGIRQQETKRKVFVVKEPISFVHEKTGATYEVLPASVPCFQVNVTFKNDQIGTQSAEYSIDENYQEQISQARTFVMLTEIEYLFDQNLIQGGDIDNAVVFIDKDMSLVEIERLKEKLQVPNISIGQKGSILNGELRFDNEPARHKLLDLIGDLSLLDTIIVGKVIATKPGHFSNNEFAKFMSTKINEVQEISNIPSYDPNQKPVKDINEIMNMLPHRFPFLMVDKIIELSENHVVGVKNVTINEAFFQGHFPNNPIFPGVLQVEAMAQTGGILALSNVPDPENWDTYMLKIDKTRFKHKVLPGDTLILKLELVKPIRRGFCYMMGSVYVGEKLVSEGEFTAQIVKREQI